MSIIQSTLVMKYLKNETGATAMEYGLIAALVAVAIAGSAGLLGTALNDKFQSGGEAIRDAQVGG